MLRKMKRAVTAPTQSCTTIVPAWIKSGLASRIPRKAPMSPLCAALTVDQISSPVPPANGIGSTVSRSFGIFIFAFSIPHSPVCKFTSNECEHTIYCPPQHTTTAYRPGKSMLNCHLGRLTSFSINGGYGMTHKPTRTGLLIGCTMLPQYIRNPFKVFLQCTRKRSFTLGTLSMYIGTGLQ